MAIFTHFPIVAATIHPYSLNGSPMDVAGGDWFVGKAAASVLVTHPVLGQIQIFNTHVRMHCCHITYALIFCCVIAIAVCEGGRRGA